nr:hypothetical protein [uncultured Arsenicibacter sp.]
MFLAKIKQIDGLNALLNNLAATDQDLNSKVGAISLGALGLEGNTLSVPFQKADGTTVTRTVDLSSLALDINVQSATIDANGNLVITETDGQAHTVNLLGYVQSYINANVIPRIEALEDTVAEHGTRLTTAEGKITTAEGAIDALESAVQTLDTQKANKSEVYTKSEIDAQKAAQDTAIGQKANSDDVYTKAQIDAKNSLQDTAISAAQTAATNAQTAVDDLAERVTALEDQRSFVYEADALNTSADGQAASTFQFPAGSKYATSVLVNGLSYPFGSKDQVCYLSKDNGTTAVMTDLAGAKLYWNGSKAGVQLEATDKLAFVVIG